MRQSKRELWPRAARMARPGPWGPRSGAVHALPGAARWSAGWTFSRTARTWPAPAMTGVVRGLARRPRQVVARDQASRNPMSFSLDGTLLAAAAMRTRGPIWSVGSWQPVQDHSVHGRICGWRSRPTTGPPWGCVRYELHLTWAVGSWEGLESSQVEYDNDPYNLAEATAGRNVTISPAQRSPGALLRRPLDPPSSSLTSALARWA